MNVIKTAIDGVVIIEPRIFEDARGYFFESFSQREFDEKVRPVLLPGFFEAYRIYFRRWSQEVFFKDSKGLLGQGKCQSTNFAAQIASTSLVAPQYNILSAVKRFMDYETIGELFRLVNQDSHELTISERIWQAILELVAAITKVFSIEDEEVIDALVNESDELAHICALYQCKMVS